MQNQIYLCFAPIIRRRFVRSRKKTSKLGVCVWSFSTEPSWNLAGFSSVPQGKFQSNKNMLALSRGHETVVVLLKRIIISFLISVTTAYLNLTSFSISLIKRSERPTRKKSTNRLKISRHPEIFMSANHCNEITMKTS